MRLSNYVTFSESTYVDSDEGSLFRFIYTSKQAKAFALHAEVADDLLRGNFNNLPDEVSSHLLETGVLTEKSPHEELGDVVNFQRNAALDDSFRSFVLLPTRWCNLGCDYCGQEHVRGAQSQMHRSHVMKRVLSAIVDERVKSVSIGWFGGEPMLAYKAICEMNNFFIERCSQYGVDYHSKMITNGSLLTREKILSLVDDCRITRFDITIDGVGEVHDSHRPSKKPGGSFDKIISALKVFRDEEFIRACAKT